MKQIRSKINNEILHLVFNRADFKEKRLDLVDPDNIIQCAALKLPEDTNFRPHKHKYQDGPLETIAQEAWIVIEGRVEVFFYDFNGYFLETQILEPGDISITLSGGHTYRTLKDSLIYEMKTGPYKGQQYDKEWIC